MVNSRPRLENRRAFTHHALHQNGDPTNAENAPRQKYLRRGVAKWTPTPGQACFSATKAHHCELSVPIESDERPQSFGSGDAHRQVCACKLVFNAMPSW
jgi:hypothetical protein